MKLILKRCGDNKSKDGEQDGSPWGLHTEDGEMLPGQQTTSLESSANDFPVITVRFFADGKTVIVEGDEK